LLWHLTAGYIGKARSPRQAQTRSFIVPTAERLEGFIRRVEENAHAEAIEEFYTEDASMQENQAPPRVGRRAHIANEHNVFSRLRSLTSKCVRPAFLNNDRVAIRWIFHFEWLDGTVTDMDEIAYQRWEGDRIAEEKFFYDPAQRTPRRPPQGG
jgi:hypothetical protein